MRNGPILLTLMGLCLGASTVRAAFDTSFSYQGRLELAGTPVDGDADFEVSLWDAESGGTQIGTTSNVIDVPVVGGVFTLSLDFGATAFDGGPRWLEITVRVPAGIGAPYDLAPRQPLVATPYALHARGLTVDSDGSLILGDADSTTSGLLLQGDLATIALEVQTGGERDSASIEFDEDGVTGAWITWDSSTDALKLGNGFGLVTIESDGAVGIGSGLPEARLQVASVGDLSLGSRAAFQIGSTPSGNLAMDTNEIMARAGGTSATLRLNNEGGDVELCRSRFGEVGIGGSPLAKLHVRDDAAAVTPSPSGHVAIFENDALQYGNVLALRSHSYFNTRPRYVTFYSGQGAIMGEIRATTRGGIQFTSLGADYAELLPALDDTGEIGAGDVVGVFGGRISRRTAGADRILVVSTQPIVVGNHPGLDDEEMAGYHPVAFLGQVPVRVRGPVQVGDLLVASGRQDGRAIAMSAEDLRSSQLPDVIGTAWESRTAVDEGLVNVLVGLHPASATAAILRRTEMELEAQSRRWKALATRLDRIEATSARVVSEGN